MSKIRHYRGFYLGDIITAYHSGYHRLVGIQRRFYNKDDLRYLPNCVVGEEYSPIFFYELVLTKDFLRPRKPNKKECDAMYCKKVTPEDIDHMRTVYLRGCADLQAIVAAAQAEQG